MDVMNTQRIIVNGILEHGGRVLIAKRPAYKKIAPNKYHLPGGHVDFNETPDEAIVREFSEEFGITVEVDRVLQAFSYTIGDIHTVGICFLLSYDGNAEAIKPTNAENEEVAWVAENELTDYFDPSDHNYEILEEYFRKSF